MIPYVGYVVDLGRSAGDRIMRYHHNRMQRIRKGRNPNPMSGAGPLARMEKQLPRQ